MTLLGGSDYGVGKPSAAVKRGLSLGEEAWGFALASAGDLGEGP